MNSLDFDALRAKELALWNSRVERLTSSPHQPGEMYLEEVDVALPNVGEVAIYAVTHFVDTLRVDGTLLGKMLVIQNTNLDSLAVRIGLTPEEMVAEFDLSDSLFVENRANVANANGGLAVAAAMVFEVETLLLVSEITETVVSMKVLDNDGVTRVGRMYESKTKIVEYLK